MMSQTHTVTVTSRELRLCFDLPVSRCLDCEMRTATRQKGSEGASGQAAGWYVS